MEFVDRKSKFPNRVLVTPESGASFYATIVRADEPSEAGTPLSAEHLNRLLDRNGDTVLGMLNFENYDAYHIFQKYRDIENKRYGVNLGCGQWGKKGVIAFEVREGPEQTSPRLARLEIGELGVVYIDATGKRNYLIESGVADATVE